MSVNFRTRNVVRWARRAAVSVVAFIALAACGSGQTSAQVYDSERELILELGEPDQICSESLGTIVYIHGGGFHSGDRSDMADVARIGAAACFKTALIDYTLLGSPPSTAEEQLEGLELGLADGRNALAYLIAQDELDPTSQTVIWGHSAGAAIALGLATDYDESVAETDGVPIAEIDLVIATSGSLGPPIFPATDLANGAVEIQIYNGSEDPATAFYPETCDFFDDLSAECAIETLEGAPHELPFSQLCPLVLDRLYELTDRSGPDACSELKPGWT